MALRRFTPLFALLLGLGLTGCLESPYPLDATPTISVDPALLGSWIGEADDNGSENVQLDIYAFSDTEYVVRQIETKGDGEQEESLLRAFLSDVEGDSFVNVQCVSCDEREFVFVKLELRSDLLLLTAFSGEDTTDLDFDSVADIRSYVTKHHRNVEAYEDAMIFRRVDPLE